MSKAGNALAGLALAGSLFSSGAAETPMLPRPWQHQDVGAVEVKGAAAHRGGVFTLSGTLDTWGTNDGFHFAWQRLQGDGEIIARVISVENTQAHAKGGVMFRESLEANARHAQACTTPGDGAQFLLRTETSGKTSATHSDADKGKFPRWLKLVRKGDDFSGYDSADGATWTLLGKTNIAMGKVALVGLTASSHQKSTPGRTVFDSVKVMKSVPDRNPARQ